MATLARHVGFPSGVWKKQCVYDVACMSFFFHKWDTDDNKCATICPSYLYDCFISESHCFIGQSMFIFMYSTSDTEVLVQIDNALFICKLRAYMRSLSKYKNNAYHKANH